MIHLNKTLVRLGYTVKDVKGTTNLKLNVFDFLTSLAYYTFSHINIIVDLLYGEPSRFSQIIVYVLNCIVLGKLIIKYHLEQAQIDPNHNERYLAIMLVKILLGWFISFIYIFSLVWGYYGSIFFAWWAYVAIAVVLLDSTWTVIERMYDAELEIRKEKSLRIE